MNKLRNELLLMKIQLNSYYGFNKNIVEFQNEYSDKKVQFFKVQKRVLKVKRLFNE